MSAVIPLIGDIMRSARKDLGLSQSDLSKKCSIPKQTIGLVENNRRMPSYEVFYRLVHALDISADRVVCPHRAKNVQKHEQFFNGYLGLDERGQRFMQHVLRALQNDVSE